VAIAQDGKSDWALGYGVQKHVFGLHSCDKNPFEQMLPPLSFARPVNPAVIILTKTIPFPAL